MLFRLTIPEQGKWARIALTGVWKEAPEKRRAEAVRRAAEAITDFSWLSRGDRVLIKPAANSPYPYPATTSPSAIQAMVGILKGG